MRKTAVGLASRSKRGRPPGEDMESHTARLLDAATEVFLEAGFSGATMTAIAKKAGASIETLYSRYGNKPELFEAIINRKSEVLFKAVGPFNPERNLREALLKFAIELLRLMMKKETRELHRLVIAESINFPELGVTFWNAGPGNGLHVLKHFLAGQKAAGKITVDNVDRAAQVFLGLLMGGITMRTMLGLESGIQSRPKQVEWAEYVVDLFIELIQKR